jgi:MFS transporter, FSR family, fosmidomycin resistance protein
VSGTETGAPAAPTTAPARGDIRAVGLLTVGHVANDINQGAVPALLPFLVLERGLSYAAAGGLVMAATVLSSAVQPLFGWLADARSAPWLVPGGLFTAGLGVALVGVAPTYPLIVAAVLLSGLGVAAFHPEAARIARHAGGERRATAMSVFAVGGNAGYALGPLLVTPLLVVFGVPGAVLLLLPAVVVALALVVARRRLHAPVVTSSDDEAATSGGPDWPAFARLTGVVVVRSMTFFSLVTLVPLFWVDVLGSSPAAGNAALTTVLVAGVIGTLTGGIVADRHGPRRVVVAGLVTSGACVAALVGLSGTGAVVAALLVGLGLGLYAPFGVTISLGQAYLFPRVGTASGVTIGLSMTIGGLAAPAVGALADRQGLATALLAVAIVPLLGAALAATLPPPPRR